MAQDSESRTSTTLLERLRSDPSDPRAWEEFVARYQPKIQNWCRAWGLQQADADDVTQLVLTKLVEKLRDFRYDPDRRFRAWLQTVTHHVWLDLSARQRREGGRAAGTPNLLENLEARADLDQRLAETFDQERLEWAMQRVTQRVAAATWAAFRLTALEGLSGAEAARHLGMPVAHVFVARHRVQKLLREALGQADP